MFKRIVSVAMSAVLTIASISAAPLAVATVATVDKEEVSAAGWNLVWSDEFDGNSLNTNNWTRETGGSNGQGWGNNELQYYTNSTDNSYVNNGTLKIVAKKATSSAANNYCNYTSARLKTAGKKSFKYGKMEARIRVSNGNQPGVWPAFWMMGDDGTGWPYCGELDIMEHANDRNYVEGTIHWGENGTMDHQYWGSWHTGKYFYFSDNNNNGINGWHTYGVIWDAEKIQWYVDNENDPYFTAYLGSNNAYAFQKPHYFLLNLALGSNATPYTGNTAPNSSFQTTTMEVDYVRAYQWSESAGGGGTTTQNPGNGMTNCAQNTWAGGTYWKYYLSDWSNATGSYSGGGAWDNFSLQLNTYTPNNWGAMIKTTDFVVDANTKYNYTIKFNSNQNGSMLIKEDTEASGDAGTVVSVKNGSNSYTGSFTSANGQTTAKILMDLRGMAAGAKIDITGLTLSKVSQTTTTTTTTKAPATTTTKVQTNANSINWDGISYIGNGSGVDAYTNKFKFYCDNSGVSLVNIQNPGFATAPGIYITTPAGISSVSLGSGKYDIQGAGVLLHADAFTAGQTTAVTITDAMGTYTVYIKRDAEAATTTTTTPKPTTTTTTTTTTQKDLLGSVLSSSVKIDGVSYDSIIGAGTSATASSVENANHPANLAIDKDTSTRWSSERSDPQSLTIDLGKVYNLKALSIMWETASAATYDVLVSEDGKTYTKAASYSSSANERKDDIILTEEVQARYIKIDGKTRTTEYGYSIFEIGAWGSEVATLPITTDMEINGFQVSTTAEGIRTIYSVDSKVEGQTVKEAGLIYGLEADGFDVNEMVLGSTNRFVVSVKSTENTGRLSKTYSKNASYAMTMDFGAKNASAFNATYNIRAYAILADGTVVYTNIDKYSVFSIADKLYQGKKMMNYASHAYLYNTILKVARPTYVEVDFKWDNILV